MPNCSVLSCKNYNQKNKTKNVIVSHHRYPKDPSFKEKWINATGRTNWTPTKWTTICSEHFADDSFILSNNGCRYLKPTAIPTLKIVKFYIDQHTNDSRTDVPADAYKQEGASISQECLPPKESAFDEIEDVKIRTETTNTEKKLEGRLRFCENKLRLQHLKIKRLHTYNQRQKKKINNMEQLLKNLEEKFSVVKEYMECLKNIKKENRCEIDAETEENDTSGVL